MQTKPLPTTEEAKAWIDKQTAIVDKTIADFQEVTNPSALVKYDAYNLAKDYRASLLANRDVLKMHSKSDEMDDYKEFGCVACGYDSTYGQYLRIYPCPTVLDILKRIAEVM